MGRMAESLHLTYSTLLPNVRMHPIPKAPVPSALAGQGHRLFDMLASEITPRPLAQWQK